MIYEGSPAPHLPGLAEIMAENLAAKKRCLYLNSPAMIAGIRSCLSAAGIDAAAAVVTGSLVLSSDQSHLSNGRFDSETMLSLLSDAADRARAHGYTGLWAAGDMTWEFGADADFAKLYEYERGLEELFVKKASLQGICMYHVDTLPLHAAHTALRTHRAAYINQTLSRVSNSYAAGAPPELLPDVPLSEFRRMLALSPQGA